MHAYLFSRISIFSHNGTGGCLPGIRWDRDTAFGQQGFPAPAGPWNISNLRSAKIYRQQLLLVGGEGGIGIHNYMHVTGVFLTTAGDYSSRKIFNISAGLITPVSIAVIPEKSMYSRMAGTQLKK